VFSLFLFLSTFTLKDLGQDSNVILSFQAGVTPLMQEQLQQLARQKLSDHQGSSLGKKGKLVVIGQDCMDALQALRSAGEEVDRYFNIFHKQFVFCIVSFVADHEILTSNEICLPDV